MRKKHSKNITKEKNFHAIRNYFAVVIFSMIILSILLATIGILILLPLGFYPIFAASPITLVLAIGFISICIASVLAYYVTTQILNPIVELSEASKTVAAGDFSVRVNRSTSIEELNTTFDNFNNMITELNSIETLRNDFVANVSHEFKTPLSSIEGYAMLLQDEALTNEEKKEYISKITESTRRLSSLTGNILLLSKLDNQAIANEKKSFRLDEQLREAILTFEKQWTDKALELDIDLAELTYEGDESLLLQVWLNLISNAVKFTPDNGCIKIKLTQQTDHAEIKITDNGIGIDELTCKHIFEKFYQGDTSHKSEGNGLGLALCKKIIEKSGGSIACSGAPGKGSCFTVKLPL